jgi:hypothetical protein
MGNKKKNDRKQKSKSRQKRRANRCIIFSEIGDDNTTVAIDQQQQIDVDDIELRRRAINRRLSINRESKKTIENGDDYESEEKEVDDDDDDEEEEDEEQFIKMSRVTKRKNDKQKNGGLRKRLTEIIEEDDIIDDENDNTTMKRAAAELQSAENYELHISDGLPQTRWLPLEQPQVSMLPIAEEEAVAAVNTDGGDETDDDMLIPPSDIAAPTSTPIVLRSQEGIYVKSGVILLTAYFSHISKNEITAACTRSQCVRC